MKQKIIDVSLESAKIAAEFIASHQGKISAGAIEEKAENDFVTFVDQESEKRIIENIYKYFPNHAILAEESGEMIGKNEYTWIIDPLDGTKNFIKGIPAYAVSIGVSQNDKLITGVVIDVTRGDIYQAANGGGAFKNIRKIHVSNHMKLEGSFFATGFPFRAKHRIPLFFKTMEMLMNYASGARRIGAAALDLCWLAEGCFDFFFERGLKAWDVAAAAVILNESGGTITDFNGQSNYLFGSEILASNGYFHKRLLELIPEQYRETESSLY